VSNPPTSDLSALSPLATELATTIARVASDIALVIDSEGVISTVAEGPAALSPHSVSWVGQRWIDTVSAGTRPKIQMLLDEVSASGVSRRREVNHPGQGGDEIPVTWAAIRLGEGGPVLAVGRDLRAVAAIQQRFVEAQQDMERHYWNRRQAETRYQLLFQVASDAVLVLDAGSLQVLESNAAALALLGAGTATLNGRPLAENLPPHARAAVTELLVNARGTGRAGEIRVRGLAGPGAVDISATPFRAGDQQQMLVRLRHDEPGDADSRAQARMAEFVETTPDAVVITDSAGGILMANPAFVRLARQTDEAQLRGRALPELLRDQTGGWSRLITRARSAGVVPDVAVEMESASGAPLTLQVTAVLMTEGEQTCLGFILRQGGRVPSLLGPDDLLAGLFDQVGRVPLAELLTEVTRRAERQLIESALLRTGGMRSVTADVLGLSAEALESRLQRHGLSGHGYPAGNGEPPHSIN